MTPSPSQSSDAAAQAVRESPFFADTPFGYLHGIVTLVTFLGCWGYSVALWGWFIGLGLGWIPALVISGIVAWLFPLAVFLTLFVVLAGGVFIFWRLL